MVRVFPTGKCFCGCGERTEGTSYFVSGHDKRAEAKVVKEVYGNVVNLLAAHGYGPDGRDPTALTPEGTDPRGLQLLAEWSKNKGGDRVHIVLETLNAEDRGGPRQRTEGFHVDVLPEDRVVRFERCGSHNRREVAFTVTVPLPDVAWVYVERPSKHRSDDRYIVRLRGILAGVPTPQFVSVG